MEKHKYSVITASINFNFFPKIARNVLYLISNYLQPFTLSSTTKFAINIYECFSFETMMKVRLVWTRKKVENEIYEFKLKVRFHIFLFSTFMHNYVALEI